MPTIFSKNIPDNVLMNLKDRNDALIKPSNDVVQICIISERVFRTCKNIFKNNIRNDLYLKIKKYIFTSSNCVFKQLDNHILNQHLFNKIS